MNPDNLNRMPVRQRRLLALMLGPLALVLLVAGVLAAALSGALLGHLVGTLVALTALVLLGIAQGLRRSARLDEQVMAERQLDAAILAAAGTCGSDSARGSDSACGSDGACGSGGATGTCGATNCAVRSLPRR